MVPDTILELQPPDDISKNSLQEWVPLLIRIVVTAILVGISFVWLFPRGFYVGLSSGLDPSWKIALHLAYNQGLIWGKDFVFTYGPLGFLSSRLALPEFRLWYVGLDIFLFTNVVYLLWICLWRLSRWSERLAALAVVYCAGSSINLVDLVIVLFLVQAIHLYLHQETRRGWHLVPAAIAAILPFYIKLNMGLITVPVMIAYCVWQSFYSDTRPTALVALLSFMATLTGLTLILPVSLLTYIKYSLAIASGYNDAMSVFIEGRSQYISMAVVLIGVFLITLLATSLQIFRSLKTIFQVGVASLLMYLLFKQGFVRADGHDAAFFGYVPMVLGVLYTMLDPKIRPKFALAACVSIVFGFAYQRDNFVKRHLVEDVRAVSDYFEQAGSSDEDWRKQFSIGVDDSLPVEWLERIGRGTVDVIPWDISAAYFNRLNYNPRPVMQSYSAYRPELDALNAQKYLSETAPDFILFRFTCIDGRYCFGDEGQTQKSLLAAYRPVSVHEHFLLLKKRRNKVVLELKELQSKEGKMGDWIPVPASEGLVYFKAGVAYSPFGKIRSLLYRPDSLRIEFKFEDGTRRGFRTYRGALEGGILASHFVDNLGDVTSYLNGKNEQLKKIVSVRISSSANYPGITEQFSFAFDEIKRVTEVESDSEITDSLPS